MRKAIARFAIITVAAPIAARVLERLGDTLERRQGRRTPISNAARTASHTLRGLTRPRRRW
jgi:hypothetical protein